MPERVNLQGLDGGFELHDAEFEDERGLRERDYWMDFDATAYGSSGTFDTHLTMIAPYRSDMLAFFEGLAAGVRRDSWQSEYAEMGVEATLGDDDVYALGITIQGPPTLSRNDRIDIRVQQSECKRFAPALAEFLRTHDPFRLRTEIET